MVPLEVALERAAHDGAEPVGGKCAWEDADVAKGIFERLFEDIGDFVLEVLNRHEVSGHISPASCGSRRMLHRDAKQLTGEPDALVV